MFGSTEIFLSYYIRAKIPNIIQKNMFRLSDRMKCFRSNIIRKKILSLPETDRGIEGLVYLNKVYEKYITLVENSAILNPMIINTINYSS